MQYKKIEDVDCCQGLVNDIKDGTCISRPMIAMRGNDVPDPRDWVFFIPDEKDKLIQMLFDLSFSKRISHINRVYSDNPMKGINLPDRFKKARVYGYELYYEESSDGTTNITPEFVDDLERLF
jgi:hypothetical protein